MRKTASGLVLRKNATSTRPRVENDPFCPEEPYGESKAIGEQIAFSYQGRLEVTSIRPSRILGPLDHENLSFFKIAKRGYVLQGRHAIRIRVLDAIPYARFANESAEAAAEHVRTVMAAALGPRYA